jgi:membrane associated rhomboid family serine protease
MNAESGPLGGLHDGTYGMTSFFRIPFRPRPQWVDLEAHLEEVLGEEANFSQVDAQKRVREWSLVLQARGVPHKLRKVKGRDALLAPPRFLDRAAQEVASFEAENRSLAAVEGCAGSRRARASWISVWPPLVLLAFFYLLTRTPVPRLGLYTSRWLQHGRADAGLILDGAWWRAATALTLHNDASHLASNIAVGGVLAWLALRETGAGLGWLCILLSGVAGNLLTAWILGPGHLSIGFSTSVFGAAGILAGLSFMDGQSRRALRYAPLAAGLGLVAMLGSGGENTDLTAHLFGFVAGAPLGLGCAWLVRKNLAPTGFRDAALAVAAWMIPVAGWLLSGYP